MMSDLHRDLRVVIIAEVSADLLCELQALCEQRTIDMFHLGDIYAAAVILAKSGKGKNIIVGRAAELLREGDEFIHKAKQMGNVCCCVADTGTKMADSKRLLQAQGAGAVIVYEAVQLARIIDAFGRQEAQSKDKKGDDRRRLSRQDYLISSSEVNALLEGDE